MNHFSIKDVEALTGIKPHTLRIWEQRYNFLKPKRTSTNIRYYDDHDLKSLLNIALLNKNGLKISRIAKLTQDEIDEIILELGSKSEDKYFQIHALMSCMLQLDEFNFEQIIRNNFTLYGVTDTMTNLIFPFLSHIGILWMSGTVNPAYEHFITNMIRSKLIVAIDQLGYHRHKNLNARKYLLFLPADETHEIGLLFANYYLRSYGHQTVYLGQNLPVDDLKSIVDAYQPHYIFTSITTALNPKNLKHFLNTLSQDFKLPVLITGPVISQNKIAMPANFNLINSVNDLVPFI